MRHQKAFIKHKNLKKIKMNYVAPRTIKAIADATNDMPSFDFVLSRNDLLLGDNSSVLLETENLEPIQTTPCEISFRTLIKI